ncbi:hypothetical protein J0S82_019802, partial [Galemys pyrenaicus]
DGYKPRTMTYLLKPFDKILTPDKLVFNESGAGKGHRKEETELRDSIMIKHQNSLVNTQCQSKMAAHDSGHAANTIAIIFKGQKSTKEVDRQFCSEKQEDQLLQRKDPSHIKTFYPMGSITQEIFEGISSFRQFSAKSCLNASTARAQGEGWMKWNSWRMRTTRTLSSQKTSSIR